MWDFIKNLFSRPPLSEEAVKLLKDIETNRWKPSDYHLALYARYLHNVDKDYLICFTGGIYPRVTIEKRQFIFKDFEICPQTLYSFNEEESVIIIRYLHSFIFDKEAALARQKANALLDKDPS